MNSPRINGMVKIPVCNNDKYQTDPVPNAVSKNRPRMIISINQGNKNIPMIPNTSDIHHGTKALIQMTIKL